MRGLEIVLERSAVSRRQRTLGAAEENSFGKYCNTVVSQLEGVVFIFASRLKHCISRTLERGSRTRTDV